MMKKCTTSVLTVLALLACQPAHAGRITMQLTEQEETANGKTLCRDGYTAASAIEEPKERSTTGS
ncbi:hypothetical protein LW586_04075 [Klebsiella quasipneumoniae]|uniref:hypothetical protein n=1 Tax=Klebsiella quasipneumoniae TaxID=1463165 RepID=UPI001E5C933C|nr:hypothetical protein [Klebsiella quasipneumoniae]